MDEMPVDALPLRTAVATPRRPSSAAGAAPRSVRAQAGRAAAHRRSDALAEAYRTYGAATYGFLLRLLGDRATAEDVQQQVFTEVWRRAGDYDPRRAGLLTWVLTIARSRAIDHLRRRIPEPRDPQLPDPRTVPADADACSSAGASRTCSGGLPENERACCACASTDELSQERDQRRHPNPIGTVKARMVRGLTACARDDSWPEGRMSRRDDIPAELHDVAGARAGARGARIGDLAEPPALRVAVPARERHRRRWRDAADDPPRGRGPPWPSRSSSSGRGWRAADRRGRQAPAPGVRSRLAPVGDAPAARYARRPAGQRTMHPDGGGLPRVGGGGFYEVWMLRDPAHLVALGSFRVGADGRARLDLPVTASARRFPVLDISREPADGDPEHSGALRAALAADHLGSAPMSIPPVLARPAHRPRPVRLRDGSGGRVP
jgi:RNA polymerase sigma-70 factor (ECF subfamily)